MTLAFFASVAAVNATPLRPLRQTSWHQTSWTVANKCEARACPRPSVSDSCAHASRHSAKNAGSACRASIMPATKGGTSCGRALERRRSAADAAMVVADGNSSDCAARRLRVCGNRGATPADEKGRSCAPPFADYQRQRRYPSRRSTADTGSKRRRRNRHSSSVATNSVRRDRKPIGRYRVDMKKSSTPETPQAAAAIQLATCMMLISSTEWSHAHAML